MNETTTTNETQIDESNDYISVAAERDPENPITVAPIEEDQFGNFLRGIATDGQGTFAAVHRRDDCYVEDEETGNRRRPNWSVDTVGSQVKSVESLNDDLRGRDPNEDVEEWFEHDANGVESRVKNYIEGNGHDWHLDDVSSDSITLDDQFELGSFRVHFDLVSEGDSE